MTDRATTHALDFPVPAAYWTDCVAYDDRGFYLYSKRGVVGIGAITYAVRCTAHNGCEVGHVNARDRQGRLH
jgi:hypothetical protein